MLSQNFIVIVEIKFIEERQRTVEMLSIKQSWTSAQVRGIKVLEIFRLIIRRGACCCILD